MDKSIGFYAIVMSAVAILIGLAFYSGSISGNIGQMTRTFDVVNQTMTLPANGATSELTMCGQKAITYTITNASDGALVPTTNYTVSQSAGADGYLAAKVTTTNSVLFASKSVNVSCNYQPKGYIESSGSRGIVVLIAIFMVILILVAALPDIRNGIIDFFRG